MLAIDPPGGWEIIVVLLIVLVLFGAKRLPDIGKGLGKGIREFRDATKGLHDDVKSGIEGDDKARDERGSSGPAKTE
jgi:sec-independent protein translocase protein TatA